MSLWNWIRHPIDSFKKWAGDKLGSVEKMVTDEIAKFTGNADGTPTDVSGNGPVLGAHGKGNQNGQQNTQDNTATSGNQNNSGNTTNSSQTQDQTGQQQESSGGFMDTIKGFFGGGLGVIVGIILLLVKGIASLFGKDLDLPALDNPAGNVIQQAASKTEAFVKPAVDWVKDKAHSAVEWVKEKWDNLTGNRGIRNNNPGNLVASSKGKEWNGEIGSDGKHAIFRTTEEGARAQALNVKKYVSQGKDTLAKITADWAPVDDHNLPDQYAKTVADRMSKDLGRPFTVNDKIDITNEKVFVSTLKNMAFVENGKLPYSDEVFVYGAKAAMGEKVGDPSKLVAAGNGKYVVDHVSSTSDMTALNTPKVPASGGGDFKKAMDQVYGV